MDPRIRFTNPRKLLQQMKGRGWSEAQIIEALATTTLAARGKLGSAMRYVHPMTGKSLVVDAASGEIFHLGDEGFIYD